MNIEACKQELRENLSAEQLLENEPMSLHTTFKIGGPVDLYVMPESVDQIAAVLRACEHHDVPFRVIGFGSDLLIADAGLRGLVMQLADNFSELIVEGNYIRAQAGVSNKKLAQAALEAGLSGYEFASGIPGGIGGAAIMNAGAYNGEFADVAQDLLCMTRDGEVVKVTAKEADWGYRKSMMNDEGMLVLEARLQLKPDNREAIAARMTDLEDRRSKKQPLEMPSAGSTFKRPEGYYAGKLIQDAGMQGYSVGGAQVSTKHAGFVVNTGGASAEDVRGLIATIQKRVFETSGVHLEPEVRYWEN